MTNNLSAFGSVQRGCQMMNLAPSSYYYKTKEPPLVAQKQEADLRGRIEELACEFIRYGYRRITAQLKREDWLVNHKKVLRIMRESSLLCVVKRKGIRTTNSNHPYPRFPNLVKDLVVSSLNEVWFADITYIRILTTFVYLAVILDALSRKVIGYVVSRRLDTGLTLSALRMAITRRQPPPGCIHHSDQGVQYASGDYVNELEKYKFQISMAAKGNPYENATAESFIKTLKYEEVNLWDYQTLGDVLKRIPFFIQEVYNKKRLHSSLGYLPPNEFESNFIAKEQGLKSCQLITT
ncbi:MAG: IS3 family transposase [Candidatus Contubernalis sp.]|nr:IS3 family transposase [Candidatus Contubernalis sp.]